MKRFGIISLLLIFFSMFRLDGQSNPITFSGDFKDVTFVEFTKEIEQQTGVSFYFREIWVKGIRVSVSGSNISLKKTLENVPWPNGISFFFDPSGYVFLTDEIPLISRLPDYSGLNDLPVEAEEAVGEETLISSEMKYINGRSARTFETIRVGDNKETNAQSSAVIHGKMTNTETGEPLIGATIYIEELRTGAATDVDGRFSLVIQPGKYTVDFNCMGMERKQYYLEVLSGGNLSISMEKRLIPIEEVMIQANKLHNIRGTQMGFERLNYKVFKEVPVVMGERDVLKIVQMLPGVQSVGEGSAGFNVRGSAADQNMIYVNKVPVYNSSHLFGFFTSINPEMVNDFTLYKSNLPASLGGRLASVLDITSRQGNMNRYTVRGGISPITASIAFEGPIQKNKSSFILSARSTYSDWMLKRMEDPVLRNSEAGFYDLGGAFTFEPGDKTLIKVFGYLSHDRFKLGTTNEYEYSNSGASINVKHRINQRTSGDFALVYGQYDFGTVDTKVPSESYVHKYRIGHFELKADLSWISLGRHKLSYGGSIIYYNLDRGTVEPYGMYSYRLPQEMGIENGVESSLYIADEITLTPRLTLYSGLRFTSYMFLGPSLVRIYQEGQSRRDDNVIDTLNFGHGAVERAYYGFEPRVSLKYLLGENNSLKFSYNRLRQYLFMLSNTIAISPIDQWKLCDYHTKPSYVDQLSIGYYQDFPRKSLSTSLELYQKWVSNVVEYRDGANFINSPHIETQILQGDQKAYGLETMIRKNTGKFTGWLTYNYSRSFVTIDSPIPGESINQGMTYPSNFDRPHNLTLVATFKLNRRFSFSSNLVYMTGRPVTYPVSLYYSKDMQYIHYSSRNSYRIPDYFRFDVSLNIEGNLKRRKLFHSFWMLNFYNVTGRKNAYSVYFQDDEGTMNGYKLSIFGQSVLTLSWNFKLGNYASE